MIDTWEAWKAQITDDPRAEWCGELCRGFRKAPAWSSSAAAAVRRRRGCSPSAFGSPRRPLGRAAPARARTRAGRRVHPRRHHGARARAGLARRGGRVLRPQPRPAGAAPGPLRARPSLARARRSLPRHARRRRISPAGRASGSGSRPTSRGSRPSTNRRLLADAGFEPRARRARHDPGARGRGDVPLGAGDDDELRVHARPLPRAPPRGARAAATGSRTSTSRRGEATFSSATTSTSRSTRRCGWPSSRRRRASPRRTSS